jgi:hypothetical protein
MGFSAALAGQQCIRHLVLSNPERLEATPAFFNNIFIGKSHIPAGGLFRGPLRLKFKGSRRTMLRRARRRARHFYKPPGGPNNLLLYGTAEGEMLKRQAFPFSEGVCPSKGSVACGMGRHSFAASWQRPSTSKRC